MKIVILIAISVGAFGLVVATNIQSVSLAPDARAAFYATKEIPTTGYKSY